YYASREEVAPEELRRFLSEQLIEATIPGLFVQLKRLPLSLAGKVDVRALPTLEEVRSGIQRAYTAPRTTTERIVSEIWQEVLGHTLPEGQRIGARDNFFTLGGHSLLATRIISRLHQAFGVELPLRRLFDAPTVAQLSGLIDDLAISQEKSPAPPLVRVPRDRTLSLSFAQQRLWFIDQLQPGSASYNIPAVLRLKGELNVPAMARTLTEISRRHEVLRTTFIEVEGQPAQVIHPPRPREIPVVDLCGLATDERQAEAQRLAELESRRSFDLARGPLLRVTLLRLGARDHHVLAIQHHIVSDGWSLEVLTREMAELYEAFLRGRSAPELPELPIQYADYAHWQRQRLSGKLLEEQLDYWRRQLAGAPPVLELPLDRPRSTVRSFRGARVSMRVPDAVTAGLKRLGNQHRVTPFITLLAAFQLVLSRYSGSHDVSVGSPVAGRGRIELENLIGFFVNTLVLRTRFSEELDFLQLLERARKTVLEAQDHQDLPFEKLVEELAPERDLSHSPLFQVLFYLGSRSAETRQLAGLELEPLEAELGTSKFDLMLVMMEDGDHLSGTMEYNSDLFEATTVRRLLSHFGNLLSAVVQQPQTPLRELPLLSPHEQHRLLVEWNHRWTAARAPQPVHQLFSAQAARTPEAVAASFGETGVPEQALSYGALKQRVDRLAGRLQRHAVAPGVKVAICLERSPELVVALLAVLEAGGAFVALDPQHPAARRRSVMRDSGAGLLLTSIALGQELTVDGVEQIRPQAGGEPADAAVPGRSVTAGDVAYVLYTSGSTGEPKGVEIRHGSLSNYLEWACQAYVRGDELRFGLYTSVAFDLTVTSIFLPLITGGELIIYGEELSRQPAKILEDGVEVLKMTPSHLSMIEDRDLASSRVRRLVVGGEAFSTALAARLERAAGAGVEIYNEYGPTEATVACMIHRYDAGRDLRETVPIGVPAAGARIYVLDRQLRPVAENVRGQICIAGDGLATGYLGRPGLTAERFVPDPFAADSRLYRTGDVARHRRGVLEFLGRDDDQVKVHGHRLELDEIRATLNRHRKVRDSVAVLVRDQALASDVLVAYYASREEQDPEELQQFLAEHLIEATIPRWFVHLRKLPLSLSGKVDVDALPPLEEVRGKLRQAFVAPRTPTEELVAGIWHEVLGAGTRDFERISALDNFFDLGGHSLIATRVLSRVRSLFAVELPLRRLFELPTVAQLAGCIDSTKRDAEALTAPPLVPRARQADTGPPLSFAQQRLWFLDQLEPGSTAYSMPFAFELSGTLEPVALRRSLDEVVRRHEALRTTFAEVDGRPVQIIAPPQPQNVPLVDLHALAERDREAEVERLARADAARPFDFVHDPLLRVCLLRLEQRRHAVLLNMHHIISDGWSLEILVAELGALYPAFLAGRSSPLPELPMQYADFAAWQHRWLQGEVLESQLAYWRQQLAGLPPVLELPIDRPRASVQSHRGARRHLQLGPELSAALRTLAGEQQSTLFMTLLAGFQATLARTAGELDFAVGTAVAGRNRLELEDLIGFFVNTLVLRSDVTGDPSFLELVARARDTVLDAHSHQDVPFEKLVEELQPERSLAHSPLFQVTFSFQNRPRDAAGIEDLELRVLEVKEPIAKFDLGLWLIEGERGLAGFVDYNRDLFDPTTITRLVGHFQRLLAAAVAAPERRLSELTLLTEVERHQLTSEWDRSGDATWERARIPIHRLFEEQVERTPDKIALLSGDETLSYRELNARANRLSHHLREQMTATEPRVAGPRVAGPPETRIGVCLQRSPEMVLAVLAVLKAGAAYVPMDPAYPAERLRYMLDDAEIDCILTGRRTTLADLDFDGRILAVESVIAGAGNHENPEPLTHPASPAYVIYTSGSTGHPKGVVVPHRCLTSYVLQAVERHRLRSEDRMLQFHTLSFDASAEEIYPTLLTGATLVLAPVDLPTNREFLDRCRRWSTTVLALPTSYWHTLMSDPADNGGWPDSVRLTLLGGEAARSEALRAWRRRASGRLLNVYGPTEGTVGATSWDVPESWDPQSREGLPIGRPLPHARIYLLDSGLRPVPVGTPGELCIAGEGVARGYLGRPRQTAEKFCPNPFGERPGARLYRTGDLARFLADGTLEFLGRTDDQVQVRGFRVEPGEIEAVLATLPGIREAVVTLADSERLIAYFVQPETTSTADPTESVDRTLDSGQLRALLKEKLPDYMVPSLFVSMDSLPRLPNGKIDRAALERQAPTYHPGSRQAYVAPRNPIEELVAEIWIEVLGLDRVGVMDSFFDLGGHSLLATQVTSRLRSSFDVELPLRHLFEAPTIAQLALRVDRARRAAGDAISAPRRRPRRDQAPPLSFAQERLWFLDQLEPGSTAYSMPLGFLLHGPLDAAILERCFDEVVRRHETLRTTFSEVDGKPLQ
ncbi:MAG: amino acid adenylation domain-containing protein, partial [Thermoanaerobaculia bacterium]